MNKKYSYKVPESEPELNLFTKYPLKIIKFFSNMSTEQKIILSGTLATLIILAGVTWLAYQPTKRLQSPALGKEMPDQGSPHIAVGEQHPPYNSNPPTSGWMYGETAGPGIKDQEVPDERLLHSMEHGGVIVYYKADLSQNQIDQVKKVFNDASGKKILVPRKNLDVPVALTSWRRLLKLQTIDGLKIKEFININSGRGLENGPI